MFLDHKQNLSLTEWIEKMKPYYLTIADIVKLKPGEQSIQHTYAGHYWLISESKENGNLISNSAGKSPFANSTNEANLELCLRLTHKPGQNPLPANISPSAALEL